MNVLVTGGAGFIGSHLVDELLALGHKVRVIDDFSTGQAENLRGKSAEIHTADISDFNAVRTAMDSCDVVFHHAALVSVPQSIDDPQLNYRSNIAGTFNVFEAARLAGIKRMVYASSSAVYGEREQLPVRESDLPCPISPYATAKLIGEKLAQSYNTTYGMEILTLRYMNVYGPRQNPGSPYSGVLSIFCQRIINGQDLTIYGDGEQTRDFVFVDDVVQANLLAAKMSFDSEQTVFNIGCGIQTSLNKIVAALSQHYAVPDVQYGIARQGDIRHSYADIEVARRQFGFEPKIDVGTGLKTTLNWFAGNKGD